jgi:SAM-dependent methyltransferase
VNAVSAQLRRRVVRTTTTLMPGRSTDAREMLYKARGRIGAQASPTSVSPGPARSALPFAREVFDAAFLVTVLGEVPDAAVCVVQLRDVLRRGGLLSITELADDPDAMTEGDIAALAKDANLEHSETFTKRFGFTITSEKAG